MTLRYGLVGLLVVGILTGCDGDASSNAEAAGGSISGVGGGAAGGSGGDTAAGTSVAGGATGAGGATASVTGPVVSATVTVSGLGAIPVATTFFGQNYWSWVPSWGDSVAGVEEQTKELKLGILRAGGANNDAQSPVPFSLSEIDDFVAFAKSVGAEPLLQVPLLKNIAGTTATAQDAADLVTYVNKTKAYGIKYFSIGNEPDLYESTSAQAAGYNAAGFCSTFKEFANAMRTVDSTIQIMGPDLSWKYQSGNDWLTPFLTSCGDVTDIVAIHRYPLDPKQCTDAQAYIDSAKYQPLLTHVRGIMAATGQADKPLAITEANITWDGNPSNTQLAASPGTFPAALWLADNLGVSLENGLHSVSYWSLSEGWTLGFFDGSSPRPAFHAMKLFSNNFGTEALSVEGEPSGVAVYAGRNATASTTALFVINKTTSPLELSVSFVEHPRTAGVSLSVAPTSLQMAIVADDGSSPMITRYSADMDAPMANAP